MISKMLPGQSKPFRRSLAADAQGATVVEFAIVAPVLVLILMFLFDMGYYLYARAILGGEVQAAGRASALETATDTNRALLDASVETAVKNLVGGGTFTFDIPTYRAVLLSFLKSIERHGFHRVLIVNGHGGNIAALTAFLPDFARETRLHVEATTYFLLAEAALGP